MSAGKLCLTKGCGNYATTIYQRCTECSEKIRARQIYASVIIGMSKKMNEERKKK